MKIFVVVMWEELRQVMLRTLLADAVGGSYEDIG